MPITKECEPYLKSTEAIAIVKSGNETFISRLLRCIGLHKQLVCTGIMHRHSLISADILQLMCDVAFQEAQLLFLRKATAGEYNATTEDCLPFLHQLFWGKYKNEFRRELVRLKVKQRFAKMTPPMQEDPQQTDPLREKIDALLQHFSAADQQLFQLRFREGMKLKDIAELLNKPDQSIRTAMSTFYRRFRKTWGPL